MVDKTHLNSPIVQGPPSWNQFVPFSYHINEINSNPNLNLIYDSNSIDIYKNGV